jgi:glycine cleavage system H protein
MSQRPSDCRFLETHEWARREGGRVAIGISDYAVDHLQDLVYIELPPIGKKLRKGESFGEIESVKAVSELFAPVGGTVVEVNEALVKDLAPVAKEPFGKGWMIRLKADSDQEFDGLLDLKSYEAKLASEGGH